MVYCAILLAVGLVSSAVWLCILIYKQGAMRFELDKLTAWRQRIEVASKLLDTDLRALCIAAHQHMKYDDVFRGIFKAFDLYGRRINE